MFDSIVPDINSSVHPLSNNASNGLNIGTNTNLLDPDTTSLGTRSSLNNFAPSPEILDSVDVKNSVNAAVGVAQDYLTNFFSSRDFLTRMQIPFGDNFDLDKSIALAQEITNDNLMALSEVKVLSNDVLNGASGAFSAETGNIYLSENFVVHNASQLGALANVLLEEFGHFIDSQVNTVDTPGDEGEIFAAIVQGKEISETALEVMRTQDDRAFITLNNQVVEIEQARRKKQGDFDGDGISDIIRQERGSWLDGNRDAEIYLSNGSWGFKSTLR